MTDMEIFKHPEFGQVRIRKTAATGDPLFIADDVCAALDIVNVAQALHSLHDYEKIEMMSESSYPDHFVMVTELGLYSLVHVSEKPEAKDFERWITHEVVPSIRRQGGYIHLDDVEEALLNPDTLIRLATELKFEREKIQILEAKTKEDRPKVLFADAVDASNSSILVGDFAKLLRENGVEVDQNRLLDWLRENGFLISQGESKNMPTQLSMELGLFKVKEKFINNHDGSIRIVKTTKITGRGQVYFINLFSTKACFREASA